MNAETDKKIVRIKAAFFVYFYILGDSKDEILDELDMAVYQEKSLWGTAHHKDLLRWGSTFLDAAGIN